MRDYYEDLWQRLPDFSPPDWARRWAFARREVRPGDRVLDLGCGLGDFTAAFAAAGTRAVGAEVAAAAVRRARTRHPGLTFELVPFDGPLPFQDSTFDLLWASEVIEHVADTARWLSEVRRVLVPRGRLLLTTPAHGRLQVALVGVQRVSEPLGDHLHLYTRRSLANLLNEFNFADVSVRSVGRLPWPGQTLLARATT